MIGYQVDLFESPTPAPDYSKTIDEAFADFHAAHPEVYTQLVRMARQSKVGMKMLFEVLRWERIIQGLPDETEMFKLNNNYTSRYARLIMSENEFLVGMFEIRELKS
jgi:hypothetical protein